jgi:dCMP deaminase
MKQKFVNFFMTVAESSANLSHARRLKVGAVIVKDQNIISFGYNGMPAGMDNNCEYADYYEDGDFVIKTKPEVIHAEANAICKLARQGNSGQDSTMFLTHAPCVECAKMIVQAGIKSVYWKNSYRDTKGLDLLHKAGIDTFQEIV